MRGRRSSGAVWLAATLASIVGCAAPPGDVDGADEAGLDGARDGSGDSAPSDGDLDGVGDGAIGDGAADPGGGPLTLLMSDVLIDVSRWCDFDGNGTLDNSIADLGTPAADLLAVGLATGLQGQIERGNRNLVHFPWVDDLSGPTDPETVSIFFRGEDTDDPVLLDDDFSGAEPFRALSAYLDGCGEPKAHFPGMSLEAGALSSGEETGTFPILDDVFVYGARATGELSPFGASWTMRGCGYAPIADLGASGDLSVSDDLSVLEVFVSGGLALGYPSVPGVTPDVDVDGDGLERFSSGADGRITGCVDGDLTEIPGRDCWQDERMADGFSLNLIIEGTSARFAGRRPTWEDEVQGECPEGPPEPSLWDPV